jgi:hypothetical protein
MYNRNYNSSQITQRRRDKAVAASFLSQVPSTQNSTRPYGSQPLLGNFDSSIIPSVNLGQMTQYTRFPQCVGISPGCPCGELNSSISRAPFIPSIPGSVSNITFTIGSIIISWNPPTSGIGPFSYIVTPYLNGIAQESVTTDSTSYRFTTLNEWEPYTFTVCARNQYGQGPIMPSSSYIIVPPDSLSTIMSGSSSPSDPVPSLKYVINTGLDYVLQYAATLNLGPTRGSRLIYLWSCSVAQGWNWISSDSRISETRDQWNWNLKSSSPLSNNDAIIWMTSIIDYITPIVVSNQYTSIYSCPISVRNRVKSIGEWSTWVNLWTVWYSYRQNDNASTVITQQPTSSSNWNQTIIVDGTTVNNISSFPQPQQWTRLTVQQKKQNYLTYNWDDVLSTCLTEQNEIDIQNSVQPLTGEARDMEIDSVKDIASSLTDQQKIIAEFWAGGPGTVSPPLMFIWLWKEYIRTLSSVNCPTIIWSLLDLSIHLFEGGRVTWRLKKLHMESRPIQEIRRRYVGQSIVSWNGTVDGSQWIPYQANNFITPPFADFPSGHSHFSKTFALTMNKWFGTNIIKNYTYYDKQTLISPLFTINDTNNYGDFIIGIGKSEIQPMVTPTSSITLSFSTWNQMADSAGLSRLYGGIHALTAHQSSQNTAVQVDGYINSSWNILTSNPLVDLPIPNPEPISEPVQPSGPTGTSEPIGQSGDSGSTGTNEPIESTGPTGTNEPSGSTGTSEPSGPTGSVEPSGSTGTSGPTGTSESSGSMGSVEPSGSTASSNPLSPTGTFIEPYKISINYVSTLPSIEVQNLITLSKQYLEAIIIRSHGLRMQQVSLDYDMIVDIDIQSLPLGVLASARPTIANPTSIPAMPLRQSVILNSNSLHSSSLLSTVLLNNQSIIKLIPVMIHEMLHGLGIASIQTSYATVGWDQFLDSSKIWYVGRNNDWTSSKAIEAYREVVGTQVYRIPVENSFGSGTAYSHWEEGMKDGFVKDPRYYDYGSGNVFHPALPDEIMTGVAGNSFYFTKLTAGALIDHGYTVDMNSPNIVSYPNTSLQKL